jgi:hypothetical protein
MSEAARLGPVTNVGTPKKRWKKSVCVQSKKGKKEKKMRRGMRPKKYGRDANDDRSSVPPMTQLGGF